MRTLVAGFGNVLLGDDGFGIEVLRQLEAAGLGRDDRDVELLDVGIGGLHFVLSLLDRVERAIIVDAVRGGGAAGSLYRLQADDERYGVFDPHLVEPSRALALARNLGATPAEVTIVGCEPLACEPGVGLSPPVAATVPAAVALVLQIIEGRA